jgi:hypothetical protein
MTFCDIGLLKQSATVIHARYPTSHRRRNKGIPFEYSTVYAPVITWSTKIRNSDWDFGTHMISLTTCGTRNCACCGVKRTCEDTSQVVLID